MPLRIMQRAQADQVGAGLPRPGNARQQRLKVEAELRVRSADGLRQGQQLRHRGRAECLDARGNVPLAD